MRSDKEFVASYRKALAQVDPSTEDMDIEQVRLLSQTELCLAYIRTYLPSESFRSVPFLIMGYPKLLDDPTGGKAHTAMATLRHLCVRFGSVSAWLDATTQYSRTRATIRCHDIQGEKVEPRTAAPQLLVQQLEYAFGWQVPWSQRTLRIADPGEATFTVDHGRTKLVYRIPTVSPD